MFSAVTSSPLTSSVSVPSVMALKVASFVVTVPPRTQAGAASEMKRPITMALTAFC